MQYFIILRLIVSPFAELDKVSLQIYVITVLKVSCVDCRRNLIVPARILVMIKIFAYYSKDLLL